ncbi:MAG TPA: dihydrolipoamide acetyltransferase family protein [Gaiellaceae bacterium]|nr:dihydrolipoamide acetyltransferase family protein [Gaiellaceae bacterium]
MSKVDAAPAPAGRSLVELSPMRAAIARRMVDSKREAPHFYVETEVSMVAALEFVARSRADTESPRVTVTALLARACAVALGSNPRLNAVWSERGLEQVDAVNLGVAVALDDGLIAPALLGADALTLAETAEALSDLVTRARAKRLRAPELSDGTFTLSNLGMFDVSQFTAIVVPPQVAILATGRTIERPVVLEGQIVARPVMAATVSADHRAVDGADVAVFLESFKSLLEAPEQLDG